MPTVEFLPLDPRAINVRTFDYGKEAINVYLRRYAAMNMALNLNRTFVLPYTTEDSSEKPQVAAYYTLAHQTLVREELPDPSRLPRYPVPSFCWRNSASTNGSIIGKAWEQKRWCMRSGMPIR